MESRSSSQMTNSIRDLCPLFTGYLSFRLRWYLYLVGLLTPISFLNHRRAYARMICLLLPFLVLVPALLCLIRSPRNCLRILLPLRVYPCSSLGINLSLCIRPLQSGFVLRSTTVFYSNI